MTCDLYALSLHAVGESEYTSLLLHLQELINVNPLEVTDMPKLNPMLRYAIMTNEDKLAFNKPVCEIVSLIVFVKSHSYLPEMNPVSAIWPWL